MSKNIIFLIHGVSSNQKKNWTHTFAEKMKNDPSFKDYTIEKCNWGYLFFLFSIIPIVRAHCIKKVQKRLREIQEKYSGATIHVIAHSYGTMLTYMATKFSDIDTDRKPINLGKIIFVGGIVKELEKFEDTLQQGQIKKIYNFCSIKDWVVKLQPCFGKSGFFGFCKNRKRKHFFKPHKNLEIYNYRFNVKHSEYFTEDTPDFYILWKQLLLTKDK